MEHILWSFGHDLVIEDIIRGDGIYIEDSKGNRYADFESGIWALPLGHSHPDIVKVIREQSGRIMHTGYIYADPVIEKCAVEFLDITGIRNGKCVFLCSGSEANEFGVKVIQAISDKPKILTFTDSFLGSYGSAGKKSPGEWFQFDWTPCRQCPNSFRCENGCGVFKSIPFDSLSAMVFEPGSSSGLVHFPPVALITSIARNIRERGGCLMANEVTTGMGRTGEWFGYQHYPYQADIVASGKGFGAGFPVSGTAISAAVAEKAERAGFHYGQSHLNDALGAAVALRTILTIRENGLIDNARERGRQLADGLNAIKAKTNLIKDIRSRGLMVCMELHDGTDEKVITGIHLGLLKKGYIIARRPKLAAYRIDPPLIVTKDDIEGFLSALESVILSAG